MSEEAPQTPREKPKAAQNEKPKRTYKKRLSSADEVIEAIKEGKFDDDIFDIRHAIEGRMKFKQEQVMNLVHEAFGPDAEILMNRMNIDESSGAPMPVAKPQGQGGNPFLQRLRKSNEQKPVATDADLDALAARHPVLDQVASAPPGPYKVSPGDGNSYAVDLTAEAPDGIVMIVDATGTRQIGITQEEWDSWSDEGGRPAPGQTTVVEQNEFEKRGAVVGGLHPSDIAE
jgi:hypothetical protein